MENSKYDVVIVGSGIAGAIVAKTLTDAGKKVLMLEAGLDAGAALTREAAFNTHRDYMQRFFGAMFKTPNSPYPALKNAPSPEVMEVKPIRDMKPNEGYYVQKGTVPFGSDNLIAAGGTTLHWLGTCLRMLPNDFKMKSLYGRGVDWPISYDELRPFYEMAEFEIGVSGETKDQVLPGTDATFFGDYEYPMEKIPQSYLDFYMMKRSQHSKVSMGGKEYELHYASTPQGRNSTPNKNYRKEGISWNNTKEKLEWTEPEVAYQPVGAIWDPYTGQRCEGNACCVPICPVQAKYNALKTLKKAKQRNGENLEIRTQSVAYDLVINQTTGEIDAIRYKKYVSNDRSTYTTHEVSAGVYVLAASAIENAKILLASNAATTSDQVGRNLMDHMCLLTWGLTKEEKVYPFRGPGSTTNISTWRDGDFRKHHAAFIVPVDNWGWGWPEFSPGSDLDTLLKGNFFGKELTNKLKAILTRQVLLHFECEQEPDPKNRVTIDPLYKDQMDNYRPVISYHCSEYMMEAFEKAKEASDQIFERTAVDDDSDYDSSDGGYVEYKKKPYSYRGAGHIVGTHRMGFNEKDSVVDKEQRTWDHKNLFLVGCGNMPTLGTSNPTLTMAALTFMACEAILKQLKTVNKNEERTTK